MKTKHHLYKHIATSITIFSVCAAISACAMRGTFSHSRLPEHQVFGTPGVTEPDLKANQAGIVVYRAASNINGASLPINMYINNKYQASLLPNGYTKTAVCAADVRVNYAENDMLNAHRGIDSTGLPLDIEVGTTAYYEAIPLEGGGVRLRRSSADEVATLSGLRLLTHTMPRFRAENCGIKVANASMKEVFTIAADAFFPFNKGAVHDIAPNDLKVLKSFVARVRTDFTSVSRIEIVGYTDPVGDESYNLRLSQERANSMKQLLVSGGIEASVIHTTGKGKTDLVRADCPVSPNNTRNECNRINRRVVVSVTGKTR